jgi:hypothetical protein
MGPWHGCSPSDVLHGDWHEQEFLPHISQTLAFCAIELEFLPHISAQTPLKIKSG